MFLRMLCSPIDLWCQCACFVLGDIYTLHAWPCVNTQSVIFEINQVECGIGVRVPAYAPEEGAKISLHILNGTCIPQ